MQEEWRAVPDTDDLLEVSNLGRMRVKDRPRHNSNKLIPGGPVQPRVTRYGYAEINIQICGRIIRDRLHRFVAKAFVPDYFEGAHVDHLDGDKLNNAASNLQWVTVEENTRRQWATGLNPGLYRGTNVTAKLTDLEVHAIQILYRHNFSNVLLAEWFGVSVSLIEKLGPKPLQGEAKLKSRKSPKLVQAALSFRPEAHAPQL